MGKQRILVIEDEEDILALIHYNLGKEGFLVSTATSGESGLELARHEKPHLVVLDLMLPGMSGLEVCSKLKQGSATAEIPVIMLTARGEESDVVAGLETGADDYITKPFSHKVLAARVRTVLKRVGAQRDEEPEAPIQIRDLVIHPGRNEVLVDGQNVDLTFTEFQVLKLLASRPGWVFSRNQIMDMVRGDDYAVTERAVDVQIVGLRKKLGERGHYIETVRGVGYRFKDQ
ncbi:MAG: DNA-binding response regulator [Desulfuromonas sp.]|mgnify:CR=1 FL=1|nr:MAG: DNA-binding response regulator [Desulfuromonas sp.]